MLSQWLCLAAIVGVFASVAVTAAQADDRVMSDQQLQRYVQSLVGGQLPAGPDGDDWKPLQLTPEGKRYFVSLQGSDDRDGTSAQTAFRTIQKGVNSLEPGDTLVIGPGEYFEAVARANLGNDQKDTVIRAAVPGTVLLRGDVPAPAFTKVEGYRFIHAATFDQKPLAVLERDTLRTLVAKANVSELEFEPGFFFYDAQARRLYVSSSDLRPPLNRHYTVAVLGKAGLALKKPRRVIIEGLATTGFFPNWGIALSEPVSCRVRACVAFMNTGGIVLNEGGSHNIIEGCVAYGHTFVGIQRFISDHDLVRYSYAYRSSGEGIAHYMAIKGPFVIRNSLAWGNKNMDFSIKSGKDDAHVLGLVDHSVCLGNARNSVRNSLIFGPNEHDRQMLAPPANILLRREKDVDQAAEFVDPANLDFRLLPTSRFRGSDAQTADRGPFPYQANVFFVRPDGDDKGNGLSIAGAWRTLERAAREVQSAAAGGSIYLVGGQYDANQLLAIRAKGTQPLAIRGHGDQPVVIKGKLDVRKADNITFERLNFAGKVRLNESERIAFRNCRFTEYGLEADSVTDLRITHCEFAAMDGSALTLKKVTDLHVTGNIFDHSDKPAVATDSDQGVVQSDYNSYRVASKAWSVRGKVQSLTQLQAREQDRYSWTLTPQYVLKKGLSQLKNQTEFLGRGPHGKALGVYLENQREDLNMVGPFLHSASDTTANLEWWSSQPGEYELAWGTTPDMPNVIPGLKFVDRFGSYSLTGLKPGQTYHFAIRSVKPSIDAASGAALRDLHPQNATLTFTTASAPAAAVSYFVAADGDDTRTGLSREQAFRTIARAASRVGPGDTVYIAGGTYAETVRLRATGAIDRPISFRSITGERVALVGKQLTEAFKASAKHDQRFDGIYFEHFGDSMSGVFKLWKSDRVQITRCMSVVGGGNVSFVVADYCADLLVRNCVAAGGFVVLNLHICPNYLIEHNLFLRPWISVLHVVNEPDQKGTFRRNVLTDNLPSKTAQPLVTIGRFESFVEADNCYFVRLPESERNLFMFYGTAAYARYVPLYNVTMEFATPPMFDDRGKPEFNPLLTIIGFQKIAGSTGSYVGDPKFPGAANFVPGKKLWTGDPQFPFDFLLGAGDKLEFSDTFATDPQAVQKKIGPQAQDFADFWFNRK
jgi:hypothetical protein